MQDLEQNTATFLRTIARNPAIKHEVMHSPAIYQLLFSAAKRFVTGEKRTDLLVRAHELADLGYRLSAEYIGENTLDAEACKEAKDELLQLTQACGTIKRPIGISFDLSHVGLLLDRKLAFSHAAELADEAKRQGHGIMISMEEAAKTDAILEVYEQLAEQRVSVGITLQVHQHRTIEDVTRLLHLPGKIRLVKGAFKETPEVALGRSKELNERYLMLAEQCVQAGHEVSFATHDSFLIDELERRGYLRERHAELELLYGVRPELAKQKREEGVAVRLYLTYGKEWFLYLCHRLAEYPPQVHQAVADMLEPERLQAPGY